MSYLIFIPARGGSKGILNKNMKMLNGKPLISYTLEFSKKIKKFKNDIFVSTDSKRIQNYAGNFGINYKYLRPKLLSRDNSLMQYAIIHSMDWLKDNYNNIYKAVIVLQPTTPIRILSEIYKAIEIFEKKKLKSLCSVIAMKEHPYECIQLDKKTQHWKFLVSNPLVYSGRQTYEKNFYFIDGSFYIIDSEFLRKRKKILCKKNTNFFISKNKLSVDIDEKKDLEITDFYLKKYFKK